MKRIIAVILSAILIMSVFISCEAKQKGTDDTVSKNTSSNSTDTDENDEDNEFLKTNFPSGSNVKVLNTNKVAEGETVAIVTTNMGVFKIRFFSDVAPKTVENFINLANEGKYNNTKIFRVVSNFAIQGGDTTNTGSGFESSFGGTFEDEFSEQALNLRGAVGMANKGEADTNGCQFYVVQAPADALVSGIWDILKQKQDKVFPASVRELYEQMGGTPWLDFSHTVFGQVYEGMDVIDAIAKVQTDANDIPLEDVFILSVQITTYTPNAQEPTENTSESPDATSSGTDSEA